MAQSNELRDSKNLMIWTNAQPSSEIKQNAVQRLNVSGSTKIGLRYSLAHIGNYMVVRWEVLTA